MTHDVQIKRVGPSTWPRYVLTKLDGRLWTGCSWSRSYREAALFANEADAEHEHEVLNQFAGPREFTVPLRIRLDVWQGWTEEMVAQFLQQHIRIDPGYGESENPSDAVCDIEPIWDKIEEVD